MPERAVRHINEKAPSRQLLIQQALCNYDSFAKLIKYPGETKRQKATKA
jgi:hypothetical protein